MEARSTLLQLERMRNRRAAPSIRATALGFEDPASAALRVELEQIAPSNATIVIMGETGTGKELVARFLHERSQRSTGPFIAVNCGALVESLIEAELFGYEKGAFTGAVRAQQGWFEAADGGTLFLDEVGDLPLAMQVKLLRVLQEREVVRLGSRTAIPVDIRVVAATNVDLAEAVTAGQFREDLFFRLNVAAVTLLPLRDRPGDIMPLAQHFLALYGKHLERPSLSISDPAETVLRGYGWPGNIRELENVIHHAVLIARGHSIQPTDLRLAAKIRPSEPAIRELEDELRPLLERQMASGAPDLFDRVTRLVIRTAFETSGGNQIRAAEMLGVTRNILRTHLGRLGIIAPRRSP